MARRTVQMLKGTAQNARIQYDPEFRQYRVSLVKHGEIAGPEASAYYTPDKEDAVRTAEAMLASAEAEAQRARNDAFWQRMAKPIW